MEEIEMMLEGNPAPKLGVESRNLLAAVYHILAKLEPDNEEWGLGEEALVRGFEAFYPDWVDPKFLPEVECEWVGQVLTMFRQLMWAYESIEDTTGINPYYVKFDGFCGNTESKYLGYVEYLIQRQSRFSELKGKNLNSHMPRRHRYQSMLKAWEKCEDRYELTRDDLIKITEAWKGEG